MFPQLFFYLLIYIVSINSLAPLIPGYGQKPNRPALVSIAVLPAAANHQILQGIEYLTGWKEKADIMGFVTW